MRRFVPLFLLTVLLGGLAASSVHYAWHAVEWAKAKQAHASVHPHGDGDVASTPCSGGELHSLDCAICSGLSGAVLTAETHIEVGVDADLQRTAREALASFRRVATPARGPPAVA